MRTLCKKALALCVVFALALTCFVGTLSVSAADPYDATLTVADVNVKFGDTTATAVLHIAVAAPGINEAIINIDSTIGTIEAEPVLDETTLVVDGGGDAYVDAVGDDFSKLFLSAREAEDATDLNGILAADITVVFTLKDGVKPGTYPINIVTEGVKAADKNETVVNLVYTTVGNFVVACDHANATEKVTTAPTCTEPGVKTFTCACGETWTEAVEATGKHEYTYVSDNAGKHTSTCTVGGETATEDCADNNADGACDKCGYVTKVECDHKNATKVVTAQPTKDAVGTMTYTCECGETWTEDIAIPTDVSASIKMTSDIMVTSVVGSNITISTKQIRNYYGEDATYFIVVNYKKYGAGDNLYMLEDDKATFTDDMKIEGSNANKSIFTFAKSALSEMTLDYVVTAYFADSTGVVKGYSTFTTSIAKVALSYAPTASANLLTALADLCNYGASAIEFFAKQNPGTDICDVTLPTEIFADYMGNASSSEGMPAAGEYNNTNSVVTDVTGSGFKCGNLATRIGASNEISYTLRADGYDPADVAIKVYYIDTINGRKEVNLTIGDLIPNGTTNAGKAKYLYYFDQLSIYDFDKTVTLEMYYKGNLELHCDYSLGNFVNADLNSSTYNKILTNMVLFANSVGVQLNLPARW